MSQSQRIIDATKQALREQGITYADVARHLGLSEASVKRLFARGRFSLDRLEAIARFLQLDLGELVRRAECMDSLPQQLSAEQEQYLVARPKLFLLFYLLLNDYDLDRVVADFRIDRPEGIRLLCELEELGLIERHPGDRVRLRVSRALTWRRGGPIRRFIDERVLREFLGGAFDGEGEVFHFVSGIVSQASMAQLLREIERVVRHFNDQLRAASEESLERRQGCSLLVAMRPWRFSLFTEYERASEPGAASHE
ncbi:helix-turn-helix domain-containing protein [Arhodomonas sp. AD133]|uniref:helix-turn-helix domain-containing protein n=1 Tax=Arhodomonas sp. AD133 TaxID=3415009 RepID=UPI003EBC4712